MQKLMKNWIFTMTTCILLSVLAVLMLLGAFEVKGFTLAKDILHLLVAVVLSIYIVFTLFPVLWRYRGVPRLFVLLEIAILILTVVALVFAQVNVPFFSSLQVCSVVGLAIWLRGAVEIVRAYVLKGTEGAKKMPLWALCLLILLSAFGVWQMAAPTIQDKHFLFVIAAVAIVMAFIFGFVTAENRKRGGKGKRAKGKGTKKAAKGDTPALDSPKAPALPAAKETSEDEA